MKALILAAGRGKRMRHLTDEVPKPLLKTEGKTFLERIFEILPEAVDEAIVIVGYQGEKIKSFLGNSYKGKKVSYVEQKELNGTGGAILLAKNFFRENERFLIFYGDEWFYPEDVEKCLADEFGWLCWESPNPKASGIATISESGHITEIIEKPENPKSNLAAGGLLSVNADVFQCAPEKHQTGEYYLTSMMNQFMKTHKVRAVIGKNRPSFSSPEDIKKAQ